MSHVSQPALRIVLIPVGILCRIILPGRDECRPGRLALGTLGGVFCVLIPDSENDHFTATDPATTLPWISVHRGGRGSAFLIRKDNVWEDSRRHFPHRSSRISIPISRCRDCLVSSSFLDPKPDQVRRLPWRSNVPDRATVYLANFWDIAFPRLPELHMLQRCLYPCLGRYEPQAQRQARMVMLVRASVVVKMDGSKKFLFI